MERIEAARVAAHSAGELIRESFEGGEKGKIEVKGKNDFVTAVDRESEGIIKEILGGRFPDIPFLAEESGEQIAEKEFWVIDPLDGTTNFIHGYQQVGVSIALMREQKVILGVVLDPLRNELFEAWRGGGAYCNGQKIQVSAATGLEGSLIGTGFPFRVHQYLDTYLSIFREVFAGCGGMRRAGAAVLDLCHCAAGRLDGFWELYLKPWDMAAGALIVEEAGGRVSDFFGKPGYLSGGNIIAGSPRVHGAILSITGRLVPEGGLDELANDLIEPA